MSLYKICESLPENHGVSYSQLKEDTGLENGVLQHHIHHRDEFVKKKGAIVRKGACGKCRLNHICRKTCLSKITKKEVKTRVLKKMSEDLTQSKIAEELELDKSTVNYHIKTLREVNALDKSGKPRELVLDFISEH